MKGTDYANTNDGLKLLFNYRLVYIAAPKKSNYDDFEE
jgi:hypothetical protein